MSEVTNTAIIKVVADTTQVEVGMRKIDDATVRTGRNLENLGKGDGLNKIGATAETNARKIEAATRNQIASIQRQIAAEQAGGKSTLAYQEALARQRGIDPAALRPYLQQLEDIRKKQEVATKATGGHNAAITQLEGTANKAGKQFSSFAKTLILGAAVGLSIDSFKSKILGVVSTMAELKTLSEKTGSSVESLSKLAFAAKQSGSDINSVAGALNKLSKGMAGADKDTKGAGLALKYLGLSAKDAAGNLKDPADLFTEIAKKLAKYEDGAGKVAIAQALLGKSGADMLPTLKLIAEQGDIAAKVTDAQATAARQYTRDIAKLDAQKGILFKTIAVSLLPTMTDFAGVLLDTAKKTNLVNGAAKELADDDSISEWADAGAMGLARLLDVVVLLSKGVSQVASSFKVVAADATLAAAVLANSNPANFTTPAQTAVSIANMKKALDDRNEVLRAANAKLDNLFSYDGAALANAMEAKIKARIEKSEAAARAFAEADNQNPFGSLEGYETKVPAAPGEKRLKANFNTSGEDADLIPQKAAKAVTAYDALIKSIKEKITVQELERAGVAELTEGEKIAAKFVTDLRDNKLKLIATSKLSIDQQKRDITANLEEMLANEKLAASQKIVAKAIADLAEDRNSTYAAAVKEAQTNEALAETFGMTKAAIEAQTLARMEDRLAQRASLELDEQEVAQLERMIEVKKRNTAAVGKTSDLEAAKKASDDAKKANDAYLVEWQRTVDKYDDIFRNGFADMLNNGQAGWKSFTKSLVTTFKTTVADQIYKMFAQPFVMRIVGSLAGIGGGTGKAPDLLSTGKSILSAFTDSSSSGSGLLEMGKKVFAGFSGAAAAASASASAGSIAAGTAAVEFGTGSSIFGAGFGGIGSSIGGITSGIGSSAAGVGASSAAGTGGAAAGGLYVAGWIAAGMALSNSLYKKGWDADNGSMNGLGNVINATTNTLLQKIGLSNSLANMLSGASTVSRLFGRKNPEITDQGLSGTFNASGFAGEKYANILEKGGVFRSDKKYSETYSVGDQLDGTFDQTIKNLLATVQDFGKAMGVETSQIDGYTKQIKLSLGSDQAKNDELIAGMFGEIGNDLARLLIPAIDSLSKSGETAADALQRLGTNYVVIDEALAAMGDTFGAVGIGSLAARERLVDLSGGLESFSKGAAYFAQNYLTQAEQTEALGTKVGAALTELGVSGITTRDQFKAVVLGLDLTTEKGAKTYAGLMNIQEAFAALNPVMETSLSALDRAKALRDQEIQIMELTGDKAGALAAARALELEGMDAALVPGQLRINLLKDEAVALDASKAVMATNVSLWTVQAQIFELNGDKAGAAAVLQKQHAAALAALDPALRGATERLYGLEAAAKNVQGARATASGLVDGVDNAFAVLQRIVATEKARLTDAHNLAMERLQDGIDAETAALTIRKAQASAAVASNKALSDAIRSTLDQMRILGDEGSDRRGAQAQIQAALAISRAGGPLPAADDIRPALETLAQNSPSQFSTFEDYIRDSVRTKSDVAALGAISDNALTVQEQALKVLEEQKSVFGAAKDAALLAYQGETSRLDSIVAGAQHQIDVLKGIDTTGLTIVQGLEAVRLAIVAAAANAVAGASQPINEAYKTSLGRAPDAAGLDYWQNVVAGGVAPSTVVEQIANSMEAQIQNLYKSLLGRSADAAGLNYFLKSGSTLADIYRNITESNEYKARTSSIQGPAPTPAPGDGGGQAFGSQSGRSASVTDLLEQLITTVSDGNAHTERLADLMDDVTEGGNGMRADLISNSGAITT